MRDSLTAPQPGSARDGARRVLICDDESQSLRALRIVLRTAGFEVDVTRTAAEALDRCAVRLPDAAIIELGLPDGDGVEVCRRLREWSTIPLLVLSATDNEEEQVRALDAGADDYLTKPFRPGELAARLRANLRRAEPQDSEGRVLLEGLEIDLAVGVVRRDGEEVHLTPIEFKLLRAFLSNRGRLLTHETLLLQVWGAAYIEDRRTLRAHVANLRRKIEPSHRGSLIHTHPGVGYRFTDASPRRVRPLPTGRISARAVASLATANQNPFVELPSATSSRSLETA